MENASPLVSGEKAQTGERGRRMAVTDGRGRAQGDGRTSRRWRGRPGNDRKPMRFRLRRGPRTGLGRPRVSGTMAGTDSLPPSS